MPSLASGARPRGGEVTLSASFVVSAARRAVKVADR